MGKKILITGLFFLLGLSVFAQYYKFSGNPEKVVPEVEENFKETTNEDLIVGIGQLKTLWSEGAFNDFDKKEIAKLLGIMAKKRMRTDQFAHFFHMLYHGLKTKNMARANFDTMLVVTEKVLDNYDTHRIYKYFESSFHFLKDSYLYLHAGKEVLIEGGSFKFRFIEEPTVAIPTVPEEDAETFEDEEVTEEADSWDSWDSWDEEESADDWGTIDETPEGEEEPTDILEVGYIPPTQPEIIDAIIEFKNIDIKFMTEYDTTYLKNTSGSILFDNYKFVGEGGKFDWSTVGLPESVYAELAAYNFDLHNPLIHSEGAKLYYPEKIDEPVEGIFEFVSHKHQSADDAKYPRFMSFYNNIKVKKIGENLDYEGGFSLKGNRIYSSSVEGSRATITAEFEGNKKFKAESKNFILGDSIISANPSFISLFINGDSVYHPGLKLIYNKNTQDLKLYKYEGTFKNSPFTDEYHNIDIYVDAVYWNLKDTVIHFDIINAKNQLPALFQSEEYFDEVRYIRMKGTYPFHPLQMAVYYAYKTKSMEFTAQELADENNQSVKTVKNAMNVLMRYGLIDYNPRNGYIKLKEKAFHNVVSRRGRKDYDNLSIESVAPGGHNASWDLNSNDLIVRGVDKVYVSDSAKVFFEPDERTLRIMKNRSLLFNGKVTTENYKFVGKDFRFDYDSFLVSLPTVDSIEFIMQVKDSVTGRDMGRKELSNNLQQSSGTLFIDKPANKSGRKKNARYPYFNASNGAYVYFDRDEVLNHAYDKSIYFHVPPFEQDSLSGGAKSAIGFEGKFISGGIIPDIEEKLEVMSDLSFGFKHKTPEEGFPLYNGSARFFGTVKLSNEGLTGNGTIKFLTTTLTSDHFTFYMDSVKAEGISAKVEAGTHPDTKTPDVSFTDASMKAYEMVWWPKRDSLFIHNVGESFNMYNKTATLDGIIKITTNGMYGEGILETRGARAYSTAYKFEENRFGGRKCKFEILSDDPAKPALRSDNVKLLFDLEKKMAEFNPERKGYASNEFPYLQYKSSIDNGKWDLENATISMRASEKVDISKSYFYSTHRDQDSLAFNAEEAMYDMNAKTLNVTGVPYIKVADAKIFPNEGKVFIRENAKMETLKDVEIVMDTVYEYHNLFDGTIDIMSKDKFVGRAKYQYVNLAGDTMYIEFSSFDFVEEEVSKKETEFHTVSGGIILEDDNFMVDPKMQFIGKATMRSNKRMLDFDGKVRLKLDGKFSPEHWLPYKNDEDVDDIRINVENPVSARNEPLFNGLYLNSNKELYNVFLGTKQSPGDRSLFEASGTLKHDFETDAINIGTLGRIRNESYGGSYIGYSDGIERMVYDGRVNFFSGGKFSNHVMVRSSASGYSDLTTKDYKMNAFLYMEFDMPESALNSMGDRLDNAREILGGEMVNENEEVLFRKIGALVGDKNAQSYAEKAAGSYYPVYHADNSLTKGLCISKVDLIWDPVHKAWYSTGSIGVSHVLKHDVNMQMEGYLEIKYGFDGDVINLYLYADDDNWYYISYNQNVLSAYSSDPEFNEQVEKKSDKSINVNSGNFFFTIGTPYDRNKFKNHFRSTYLGVEGLEVEEEEEYEDPYVDEFSDEFDDEAGEYESEDPFEDETEEDITDPFEDESEEVTDPFVDEVEEETTEETEKETSEDVETEELPEETTDDSPDEATEESESTGEEKTDWEDVDWED